MPAPIELSVHAAAPFHGWGARMPPAPPSDMDRLRAPARTWNQYAQVAPTGRPGYVLDAPALATAAADIVDRAPGLVRSTVIGGAVDGTQLLALQLRGNHAGARVPRVVVVAGQHAREVAAPAVALDWVKGLVQGYGRDADLTRLLDTHDIDVVPLANPSGTTRVVQGFGTFATDAQQGAWELFKRTNGSGKPGTDLNRNYPDRWGTAGVDHGNPAADNFPGRGSSSEPETRAIMDLVDQGPVDRPALLVDLHAFGNLLIHDGDPADAGPAGASALSRVARGLAPAARLTPQTMDELYPASGSLAGWAAREVGVQAFLVEMGRDFLPTQAAYRKLRARMLPTLTQFTRIAGLQPDAQDAVLGGRGG